MLQTSLNIFDLLVLTVIGLSALLSFFRGFAREMISLFSWVGASVVTLYAFPTVSKWIEPQVKNPMIASGLASIGVFIVTLILISIFAGILIKFIKPSKEIGFLDNLVGLMFGVARGVLLVSIGYFIMTIVMPAKDYPVWVKEAYTRPYVATSARYISKLTPTYIAEAVQDQKKNIDDHARAVGHTDDLDEEMAEEARHNLKKAVTEGGDHTSNLPSFEDLQKRIRAENEAK